MKFPHINRSSVSACVARFGRGAGILVAILFLTAIVGVSLSLASRRASRLDAASSGMGFGSAPLIPPREAGGPSFPAVPSPTPTIILPTPDPWDGKTRVTVLVLGVDSADWQSPDRVGPPRTDTMILLTIDPLARTAGILSIPRDLWVPIPGIQGEQKINTAYRFGELYKMPGGGPGLAMRTVEQLLGVPINFYVRVDFDAFQAFIDEIGGIDVNVPQQIKIDPIGPGNTVVLEPGVQHLDGALALAYARNRYTQGDDFDRMARQQQVILAVRDRILNVGALPRLALKAPGLFARIQQDVQTNISLQQAIQLAWLAAEIPSGNINSAAIGPHEVSLGKSPDGEDIYIPDMNAIRALRDQIFTSSGSSERGMTTGELILAENARISLVNESGDPSLADRVAAYLKDQGLNVIQTAQGSQTRAKTRLVEQTYDPYTTRFLINLLKVSPGEIYEDFNQSAQADILLYLGEDLAANSPF